jgi:hypothetical protein
MPTFKEAENVIAITAHRLMFFIRLALVASLAGYMLPTVSFAMHGDFAATYPQKVATADAHASHSHDAAEAFHDHGDQTDDHHENTAKQDCCSNFCLNMAVVDNVTEFRAHRVSAALDYTNDLTVFAEPIGLNRPPAFRT